MKDDTLIGFDDPVGFSPDPLTAVLRQGARDLLAQAVEAEVAEFLREYTALTDDAGRQRLVRHGHLPEREVLTGIGRVSVKVPRVRDRGTGTAKIRFTSSLLPPYLRKAKSVEALLPWLYLKGISTGDFGEALGALLGANAEGLSSSTISRLKAGWWKDYERWRKRDLSARRYVYLWADGVYFKPAWTATSNVCWLLSVLMSGATRTFLGL